jgi:hypothetical protein
MQRLGLRDQIPTATADLEPLSDEMREECFDNAVGIAGKPLRFPQLPSDHVLVCVYNMGMGEILNVCETIKDMQTLFDEHLRGTTISLEWYVGGPQIAGLVAWSASNG